MLTLEGTPGVQEAATLVELQEAVHASFGRRLEAPATKGSTSQGYFQLGAGFEVRPLCARR